MAYRLPDNRLIKGHKSFELDGVRYSKQWLQKATAQELSDLNIVWEEPPAPTPEEA